MQNQTNPKTRSPSKSKTQFHSRIAKADNIHENLEAGEKKSSANSEKITGTKFLFFFLYYFSLIYSIQALGNFTESQGVVQDLCSTFTNQKDQSKDPEKIYASKPIFASISTTTDLYNWISLTFLPVLYSSSQGFQSVDSVPQNDTLLYYQSITPLRFLQTRASVEEEINQGLFSKRWRQDQSDINKQTFGKVGYNYSEEENGFIAKIPLAYKSKKLAFVQLEDIFKKTGFIDWKTKTLSIDLGIFNKMNNFLAFVDADFEYSPAGNIISKRFLIRAIPALPYRYPNDPNLLAFQILFAVFFVYYLAQEVIKVTIQIKNALMKGSGKGPVSIENAAKAAKEKIQNVVMGIINHIKDPWTFLNVVSIICSAYGIISWITIYLGKDIEEQIVKLELVNGEIKKLTEEKIVVFSMLNDVIKNHIDKIYAIYKITGLNIIILTFKAIKYVGEFVPAIKDLYNITVICLGKFIPFIILVLTVFLSFAVMINFYFGKEIEELSTITSTIQYFLLNLNGNYEFNEELYQFSHALTLVFDLIFVIVTNYIMGIMFLIYVVHVYSDYYKEKESKEKVFAASGNSSPFKFEPHLYNKLINFFRNELRLQFYHLFFKQKFEELKQQLDRAKRHEEREIVPFAAFDFDFDISSSSTTTEKPKVYLNERSKYKVDKKQKLRTTKLIWSTISSLVLSVFFLLVALEHQKIVDGRKMVLSIESLFGETSVQYIDETGKKRVTQSPINLYNFQSLEDVVTWSKLFQAFATKNNITLSGGNSFSGYFFGGVNFMLMNQYRITIRKSFLQEAADSPYKTLSTKTLSETFEYLEIDPSGELKTPFKGKFSNITYNYSTEDSYESAGGYVFYSPINQIASVLNRTYQDKLLDSSIISLTIDFPIYQITSDNLIYVALTIFLDDAFNVPSQKRISLVGLNYYQDSSQKFIAFLEVCVLISFFYYSFSITKSIITKHRYYNYWYSLQISYFPEIMLCQREKKTPEFIRKIKYVIEFREVMDAIFLIFLGISIGLWGYFLKIKSGIREETSMILAGQAYSFVEYTKHISWAEEILSVSKLTESLLILTIGMKVMYSFSFFENFKFLTETLKRAFENIIALVVILVICLVGFGAFLICLLGTQNSDFLKISDILSLQMSYLASMDDDSKYNLFSGPDGTYIFIFYFLPFQFFIALLVANLFFGIVTYNYKKVKIGLEKESGPNMTWRDLVENTKSLFRKKKDIKNVGFDVSDDMVFAMKGTEVFEDFNETVDVCKNKTDIDQWSNMCTKNIIKEKEARSSMKKLLKGLAKNGEDGLIPNQQEVNLKKKTSEFKMRLKFWDYLRFGENKLLLYMKQFDKLSEQLEFQMIDPKLAAVRKNTDLKIKKYILYLEKEVAQNMEDIRTLKKTVTEYQQSIEI